MKKFTLPVLLLSLTLFGCASTFKATHDHDPSQNFAAYKSFSWISDNPLVAHSNQAVNPLLETRLMSSTRGTLEAKGYRFTDNRSSADFVVSFTVGARDKIRVTSYPSGYRGAYGSYGGWGGRYYGSEVDVRQYTEGVLAIDLFDVSSKRAVWHGVASKSITKADREKHAETVRAAVSAVMAGFPPP